MVSISMLSAAVSMIFRPWVVMLRVLELHAQPAGTRSRARRRGDRRAAAGRTRGVSYAPPPRPRGDAGNRTEELKAPVKAFTLTS
jgi:hypothetical protein